MNSASTWVACDAGDLPAGTCSKISRPYSLRAVNTEGGFGGEDQALPTTTTLPAFPESVVRADAFLPEVLQELLRPFLWHQLPHLLSEAWTREPATATRNTMPWTTVTRPATNLPTQQSELYKRIRKFRDEVGKVDFDLITAVRALRRDA